MLWPIVLALTVPSPVPDRREALAHYGAAVWLQRTDRPASAWRHVQAAARLDPESPAILRERFRLERRFGRTGAAIFTGRAILNIEPTDADTARELAVLLHDVKFDAEAVQVLTVALQSPVLQPANLKRLSTLNDLARVAAAAKDAAALQRAAEAAITILKGERTARLGGHFETEADVLRELLRRWEQLAEAFILAKKFPEARNAFREVFALAEELKDPAAAVRSRYHRALVLEAEGKFDEAATEMQAFLTAAAPNSAEPYERFANLLRSANRPRAVVPALRALVPVAEGRLHIRWVYTVERTRDDPAAWNDLRVLFEKTTDPELIRRFAAAYRDASNAEEFLDFLDGSAKALRLEVGEDRTRAINRRRALLDAVKADTRLGDLLLAKGLTAGFINREPDTRDLLAWLAERRNDYRKLERILLPLAETGNAIAVDKVLDCLKATRNWQGLLDFANRQSLKRNSNPLYWASHRATAMAELGDTVGALRIYEDQQKTISVEGRLNKSHLLVTLGRPSEAAAAMTEVFAKELTPEQRRQAFLQLAEVNNGLRRYTEADAAYQTLLDEEPDNVLVLNNFGYNLADQGRRLPEAEVLMRRAIELDTMQQNLNGHGEYARGTYLDSLGWILFRRDKLVEAEAVFAAAVKSADGVSDAVVWDHYGDVLFRLGKKDEARKSWSRAADLFTDTLQGKLAKRRDEILWKLKQ